MAKFHYPWKRFWIDRDSHLQVDEAGFLVDPNSPWFAPTAALVSDLAELEDIPCVVLLGEPGSGKTTALSDYRDKLDYASADNSLVWANLRDYSSGADLRKDLFGQSQFETWQDGSHLLWLFLDGLDEGIENLPAITGALLTRIQQLPVERLRLRVTCRTAEWPTSFEQDLRSIWSSDSSGRPDASRQSHMAAYEITPLRRTDVVQAAHTRQVDPEAFFAEVFNRGAVPFALRPVTLDFLLSVFERDDTLPGSITELYSEGCRILCEETNLHRRDQHPETLLTAGQRLHLARRVAALTILGSKAAVWTAADVGQKPVTDLTLDDLVGSPESEDAASGLVSQRSIQESLQTALFTSRGANRLGWAHQTFGEFLAAQFLVQAGVSIPQARSLLLHPVDNQVIPQLRGVAAWVASMREDLLALIAQTDPDVVIQADLVPASDEVKAGVVDALLGKFARIEIIDDWSYRSNYQKLCHAGLEARLRPIITDPDASFLARRVAIDLAEACDERGLQNELLELALNTNEHSPDRINAAYAIWRMGDASTYSRLLPLLSESTDTDPDFELRGVALQALWSEFISTEEMFESVVPIESHLIGEYSRFLHYLPERLEPHDFVIALEWVSEQKSSWELPFGFEQLINETLLTSKQHLSHDDVLPALARAIWSRLAKHDHVFRRTGSDDESRFLDDEGQLRELVRVILSLTEDPIESTYLLGIQPPLLDHRDTFWLIEEFSKASDDNTQRAYAKLIGRLADMKSVPYIDAVLRACEKSPILAAEFGNPQTPVELNSPEAEDQRRRHQEMQEMFKPIERPTLPDERSPAVHFRVHLEAVEAGESERWWRASWFLGFRDDEYHYVNDFETDIRKLPGWQPLDQAIRRRLVVTAPSYLVSLSGSEEIRRLDPDKDRRNIAGYRALRLLLHEDVDALVGLSPEVWGAWGPTILGMTMQGEVSASNDQDSLCSLAYHGNSRATLDALSQLVLERDAKDDHHIRSLEWTRACWDSQIEGALLSLVQQSNLRKVSLQVVLRELVRADVTGIQQIAERVIRERNDGEDHQDRATVTGAILLQHAPDAGWPVIWPALTLDPPFGRCVIESVAAWLDVRGGLDLHSRLSEMQLADLYEWLETQYPEDQDPGYDSGRTLTAITTRHEVADLRKSVIRQLRDKGTFEAWQQMDRLIQTFPDNLSLKLIAIDAGQLARQVSWMPPTPDEILALTRDQRLRLVQSGEQLLDVVEEVLAKLQADLHGETPRVRNVWNEWNESEKKYRPKDEEDLSDFLKNYLEDHLAGRAIVVGREVQIRRPSPRAKGEDTDVHIDAITKSAFQNHV